MKTYHITPELAGLNRKRKVILFLITAGAGAAFRLITSSGSSGHLLRNSIEALVAAVFGGIISLRVSPRLTTYTVVVSDDCVTCAWDSWLLPRRAIRKEQAKTIVETSAGILRAPGLRISKYGSVGTWFWGCVWIPKAIPEYEYARSLIFNWSAQP